jgi:hypothetical protein
MHNSCRVKASALAYSASANTAFSYLDSSTHYAWRAYVRVRQLARRLCVTWLENPKKTRCLVVTIEQLEALDLLIWTRSGADAAERAFCDQSSISRRVGAVLAVFNLTLKRGLDYQLIGDLVLLRLQRWVHQHARFLGHRTLRLEANHYIRDQLIDPPLLGWMLGPCHHRGYSTLLSLLRERVIDAWITSDLLDLPESTEFAVIPLWEWPGELVVHPCHPLAHERRLTPGDLDRFPSLMLPDQLYPKLAAAIHVKGFGKKDQFFRYDIGSWDAFTEDAVTISYGSCLSRSASPNLCSLEWDLGLTGGEALIVLREWIDEPALAALIEDLRRRQAWLQHQHPQLIGRL